MTFSGDPFRILGLASGATDEQIKRAYRALAKRYHPDSAGESALPRFLAIQAAYDMLTGTIRHPRPGLGGSGPGAPRPPGGPSGAARGSRADAGRTSEPAGAGA